MYRKINDTTVILKLSGEDFDKLHTISVFSKKSVQNMAKALLHPAIESNYEQMKKRFSGNL